MNNELLANKTFNSETSRSSGLIPGQLRTDAAELIKFLEEYYRLSNSTGNTTNLLNDFLREHDIDSVTESFFSGIQNLIAKNIPVSTVFDRQTLYKRIIDYYSLRGSKASVKAFFKIFYNESASVYYPKDDLFKPSDGQFQIELKYSESWYAARKYPLYTTAPTDWVNSDITEVLSTDSTQYGNLNWINSGFDYGIYINTNSFPSESRLKIQDSYYWQDYSYVINAESSANIWKNDFLKLVHPAGLRYFYNIQLIAATRNNWIESISYSANVPQPAGSWKLPPLPGDHSPVYQPGDLNAANTPGNKLPWNIISHDSNILILSYDNINNLGTLNNSLHSAFIDIQLISLINDSIQYSSNFYTLNQLNMNSTDYMNQLKFIDTSAISGFESHVIQPLTIDTTHSYSPINGAPYSYRFPPTAIGTYITLAASSVTPSPPADETIDGIVVGNMTSLSTTATFNPTITLYDASGVVSSNTNNNIYYKLRFRFTNPAHHNKLVNIIALVPGTSTRKYKFQLKCNPRNSINTNWNKSANVVTYSHIIAGTGTDLTNYGETTQSPYYFIIDLLQLPSDYGFITWNSLRWYGKDRTDISFNPAGTGSHESDSDDHNGAPWTAHLPASSQTHDHSRDDHLFGTAYDGDVKILNGYINSTSSVSYNVSINRTVPTTYLPILPIVYGTTNTYNDDIVDNDIIDGTMTYQNQTITVTAGALMPLKAVSAAFVLNVSPVLPQDPATLYS